MKRGVERPLLHREDFVGQQLDAFRYRPPVERSSGERLEDQKIERALQQIGWFGHVLTSIPRLSTIRCLDHRHQARGGSEDPPLRTRMAMRNSDVEAGL